MSVQIGVFLFSFIDKTFHNFYFLEDIRFFFIKAKPCRGFGLIKHFSRFICALISISSKNFLLPVSLSHDGGILWWSVFLFFSPSAVPLRLETIFLLCIGILLPYVRTGRAQSMTFIQLFILASSPLCVGISYRRQIIRHIFDHLKNFSIPCHWSWYNWFKVRSLTAFGKERWVFRGGRMMVPLNGLI